MYAEHFGFKEKPFSIKDNPNAFYHNTNFDRAYAAVLSGILEPQGCVILSGEAGVGKTALLHRLMAQNSAKDIHFIYHPNTFWKFNDLLVHIDQELHLTPEDTEQAQLLQTLQDFLVAQCKEGKSVVLILDNAHALPEKVLRHLPLLFFPETSAAGGLRVLLSGLPSLEENLESKSLQPLTEQITVRSRLTPLPDKETASFIEHQLNAAGYHGDDLFPAPVIASITGVTRGIPRSIAALCDAALFLASLESARTVTPEIIKEAANLALISPESPNEQKISPSETDTESSPIIESVLEENSKANDTDHFMEFDSDFQLPALELNFGEDKEPITPIEKPAEPADNPMSEDFTFTDEWIKETTGTLVDPAVEKLILAFDKDNEYVPGQSSILCALVMNASATLFREIGVRCHSPDLTFLGHPRPRRIKLLGRRDASIIYLKYQGPAEPLETTLTFQVDVRDHQGEWRAYDSKQDIFLRFPGYSGVRKVKIRIAGESSAKIDLTKSSKRQPEFSENQDSWDSAFMHNDTVSEDFSAQKSSSSLEQMLIAELILNAKRTERLQTEGDSPTSYSTQGKIMSRAILRSQNPHHAPERIELVSRPFMVFGRYNEASHIGFADFALGFLPQYLRISRLHCAICAMDEGLAIMHVGARDSSYTNLNNKRLVRGHWQRIESGDVIEICGLYDLRAILAWDTLPSSPNDLSESIQGEKIGRSLLQTVDLLKRLESAKSDTSREELKTSFNQLIRLQDEAAKLNGVDSLGPLLYARFQRMDDKQQRVTHVYLPKWISIGSSPQAGLCINAKGVVPKHAEILFNNGMYWIQDHAGQNDVKIGGHRLKLYEAIPLEDGDIIDIAAARFSFEAY